MKVLVLTKARYNYSKQAYNGGGYGQPLGLQNGAEFLADGLREAGVEAKHVGTVDGNTIDKEVHDYAPTVVVLEALWVTPEKVQELSKLHPTINWIVRLHSNIPFLSMEGIAVKWVKGMFGLPNVTVAANNKQTATELTSVLKQKVVYLPNIYLAPLYTPGKGKKRHSTILDISCFGAIRPFKNQLIQAVAAIEAANKLHKKLRLHMNGTRIEQRGDTIMQNVEALFEGSEHELVLHPWQKHEDFLLTVAKMDLGMQVSFTESFNIVAADHVHVGVPLVVSDEITWLGEPTYVLPTKVDNMVNGILRNLVTSRKGTDANSNSLQSYNDHATKTWLKFLD